MPRIYDLCCTLTLVLLMCYTVTVTCLTEPFRMVICYHPPTGVNPDPEINPFHTLGFMRDNDCRGKVVETEDGYCTKGDVQLVLLMGTEEERKICGIAKLISVSYF